MMRAGHDRDDCQRVQAAVLDSNMMKEMARALDQQFHYAKILYLLLEVDVQASP